MKAMEKILQAAGRPDRPSAWIGLIGGCRTRRLRLGSRSHRSDRTRIEQQRLDIERQRLAAEDADREMRRQQAEQVRELRNLMADASISLERIRRTRLT